MRALSSVIHESDPRDPLVQAARALLDAGLIVASRDGAGRFVQMSDVYGGALGTDADVRGGSFIGGQRYFDTNGREIPRAEHPAHVARMSGIPQRNRILGVRSPNGRELWFQASFMPIEQEPEGWSVLTIGVVLDAQVFTAPTIEATTNTEPLLAFAETVAGRRWPVAQLAGALVEPLENLIPPEASAVLLVKRGEMLEVQAIRRTSALATPPIRLEGDAAQRWSSQETYYVPDVRDTDVIGNRVAIEYDPPIRTLAVVPVLDPDGARVAALAITHPEPEAFLSEQISSLERLARLAGAALTLPPPD
jgi:hypothetical protein